MHILHLNPIIIIMPGKSTSFSSSSSNPNPNHNPNPFTNPNLNNTNPQLCPNHPPCATLDLIILILELVSGAFLIISYFSYLFNSLSLLISSHLLLHLPDPSTSLSPPIFLPSFISFLLLFLLTYAILDSCFCTRSRKCHRPGCKGLKKALEFDLQLQTQDCLRSHSNAVKDIDSLPWKGGNDSNPDYDCLRAELRKMAPPNGRAVLLFRANCGCPVAKLEGWASKNARRSKKALAIC